MAYQTKIYPRGSIKMVLTRRSSRRHKPQAEPDIEVSTTLKPAGEDDKELDLLTEQVLERLTSQQEKVASEALPPDVIELSGATDDCPFQLASTLQPKLEETPYFSNESLQLKSGGSSSSLCVLKGEVDTLLKKSVITADFEKKDGVPPIRGPSKYARERANKAARLRSAGKGWFDMPAPQVTPDLKNDLKLLRMRNALDPSRHYKANDSKQLPRYFQVGRVVSGPGEFYSSRIPRRQQKQSLVEELLSNEESRAYHKKKYLELQAKFSSGTRRKRHVKRKRK